MMLDTKDARDHYLAAFEALEAERQVPAWLLPVRKAAIARFAEIGFPTPRDEEWKYTNVAPIATTEFRPADSEVTVPASALEACLFGEPGVHRLVIVNGRFAPELSKVGSLPGEVRVGSLAALIRENPDRVQGHLTRLAGFRTDAFAALNTALFADGAAVVLPRGAVIEAPIHVLYVTAGESDPVAAQARTLVLAGANSQATLIESYISIGDGPTFTNAVLEINADDGAVIDSYRVGRENDDAFHVGSVAIRCGRDSTVRTHAVTLGGRLVRNNVHAVLDGEGGHCTINGLYVLNGAQHVDNHLRVDHAKPRCTSWEYFKGVLDDRSRGVFTGRIFVAEDAQKTDAKQTNMSLLLSDEAQVESRPQLEIFADDVRCTHGATIGQVDENALFYLRARGLNEELARSLLIYGFASESLEQIRVDALRGHLENLLFARLPHGNMLPEAQ